MFFRRARRNLGANPKRKLVIVGAGGHGSELVSYARDLPSEIDLIGVIDDTKPVGGWNGTRILGGVAQLPKIILANGGALSIVTAVGDNLTREKIVSRIQSLVASNLSWLTLKHASASVGLNSDVGEGSLLAPFSVVTANVIVGKHCILNVKTSVSHDCVVGDYVNINPGATIAGNCQIGEGAYIGAGAVVIQKIRIGQWATIGAGAVVIRDVPDFATVVGVPARVIKVATVPRRAAGAR